MRLRVALSQKAKPQRPSQELTTRDYRGKTTDTASHYPSAPSKQLVHTHADTQTHTHDGDFQTRQDSSQKVHWLSIALSNLLHHHLRT
eukprot:m.258718 g.258718  ORF g.258718 m.258718 type:complete len:88 (+) comp15547_c3_seq10:172-435(+)